MSEERSRRALLEEVSALALAGRFDEALERLGDGGTSAARLLRGRILIARGAAGDSEHAQRGLEDLATLEDDWQPALALARLEHRNGRPAAAARRLKEALERFHARSTDYGGDAPALAALLVEEADRLARSGRKSEHAPLPDSVLLLRLVETGKRLALEADPEEVLRIALREAIELGALDRGFVLLPTNEGAGIAVAVSVDRSEVERPAFEFSRTLARRVMQDAVPVYLKVGDMGADQQASRSLSEIGALSVACVPMLHLATVVGVLYLDGKNAAHTFADAKRRLIELFASQAAAALVNARMHQARSQALDAAAHPFVSGPANESRREQYGEIVGAADSMQDVYRRLDLIVPTDLPVLVLGETGTGKELAAREIHARGPRRSGAFVAMNCAGMAETLLESELFGHERGAFTGADRARPGLFELAHRGTLFLDEVGDMSPRMQGNLLRVLQSGELRRVGGRETKQVDVRVIAATHRDLAEMVPRGEFRQDLYYRLNVLSLRLPALRQHTDDVPLLFTRILQRNAVGGRPAPVVTERAMRILRAYAWPGNVRELENVARRLVVQGTGVIEERHLPSELLGPDESTVTAVSLQELEAQAIRRAVATAKGRRTEAARLLGIDRKTLYLKLKRLGLDV